MMLKHLTINHFRAFKNLELPNLARINLISGKNNAGKTGLLEAVYLHVSNFSSDALFNILDDREEFFSRKMSRDNLSPVKHFYFGHKITDDMPPLFLESNIDKQALDVGYSYVSKEDEKLTKKYAVISISDIAEFRAVDDIELSILCLSNKHGVKELTPLFDDGTLSRTLRRKLNFSKEYVPVNFVQSSGISHQKIAEMWDRISLTDMEHHVIEGLKIIEPRITGVSFVQSDSGLARRVAMVKLSHLEDPVTLRSLGDGMSRIFHIILSLVNSENGTLLIDEFENGLHWSIQNAIWKIIFELSSKHNIQVIATSHSNDCIASFKNNWLNNIDDGMFYRIENSRDGNIEAIGYDLEDLSDSLGFEIEVR
ncbi:AAA family ATPase [Vibrio parahaemolyticus]|uniref:Putative ATP/GTP phosphatase protein n=1 Tax=marine metagenome TaxID=408172 RepID=A0A5E4DMP6_9ZZZZ|nr:ATP-binding protein [Vibrio parahaemolyticus]MBM5089583.1 AAA family ATPase [Vibrio parahaemolyticus]MBM5182685.1 AAA family ATPase [Vibrio parahaemolyticus]HCE2071766.1 AAA family ATPase [Vibrio parahaemolyticus]HCH5310382.1 AAA family ATPase [Vibrio parahaemolyticus]